MKRSLVVLLATIITVLVGAFVFGQISFESQKMDRSAFQTKKIRILAYTTFVSSFGPGPEIARRFEKLSGYKVELINIGDSGLLIQKLLDDPRIQADVVLGFDRFDAKQASEKLQWKSPHSFSFEKIRPELQKYSTEHFVPVEWSPLTFIYRKGEVKTSSGLKQFFGKNPNMQISLQDPRLSTPGQQFLFWWTQFDTSSFSIPQKVRVSPSWSQAYGLFKRGVAQSVFSYMTSVVFHWEKERDLNYTYLVDPMGHPFQVEYAGVSARCKACDVAKDFVDYLLEPQNQTTLMQKNFMLPAAANVEKSGSFSKLKDVKLLDYENLQEFLENKDQHQDSFFKTFK